MVRRSRDDEIEKESIAMSFFCPQCRFSQPSLEIRSSLELPSDARSDEITLQIVACTNCGFSGLALYEESRRGALDEDAFTHTGYRMEAKALHELEKNLGQCPRPRDHNCQCRVHRKLGRQDPSGLWIGIKDLRLSTSFLMLAQPFSIHHQVEWKNPGEEA
jgi:hypothetical protein